MSDTRKSVKEIDAVPADFVIHIARDRFDAFDEACAAGEPSAVLNFLTRRAIAGMETHGRRWKERVAELEARVAALKASDD